MVSDQVNSEPQRETLGTSEAQLLNALKVARAGHWKYDIQGDRFTRSTINFIQSSARPLRQSGAIR